MNKALKSLINPTHTCRFGLSSHFCFPLSSSYEKPLLYKIELIGESGLNDVFKKTCRPGCLENVGRACLTDPLGGEMTQEATCFNEGQFTSHFPPECASPQTVLLHILHYQTMRIVPQGTLQSRALCFL